MLSFIVRRILRFTGVSQAFICVLHSVQSVKKQPPRDAPRKKCSENMQQIYRRTPIPKCDFSKVAKQLYWNRTSVWVLSCKFAVYLQKNLFLTTPLVGCFCSYRVETFSSQMSNVWPYLFFLLKNQSTLRSILLRNFIILTIRYYL